MAGIANKVCWVAMKKIFIYTCTVVYDTRSSSLKIEDNDEVLSSIFGIELLATQTNSKSGKVIAQVRAWVFGKPNWAEKDHKMVCRGEYPVMKCPFFLLTSVYPSETSWFWSNSEKLCTFVISTKQSEADKISLAVTRQITQKLLQPGRLTETIVSKRIKRRMTVVFAKQ